MSQVMVLAEPGKKCCCDNCGHECDSDDLEMISDFEDRVDAGRTVPAGACPECDCLSYLIEPAPWSAEEACKNFRTALQWIADHGDTGEGGRPAYHDMRTKAREALGLGGKQEAA